MQLRWPKYGHLSHTFPGADACVGSKKHQPHQECYRGCIWFCLCLVSQVKPSLSHCADHFQYSHLIRNWWCRGSGKGSGCKTNLSFREINKSQVCKISALKPCPKWSRRCWSNKTLKQNIIVSLPSVTVQTLCRLASCFRANSWGTSSSDCCRSINIKTIFPVWTTRDWTEQLHHKEYWKVSMRNWL